MPATRRRVAPALLLFALLCVPAIASAQAGQDACGNCQSTRLVAEPEAQPALLGTQRSVTPGLSLWQRWLDQRSRMPLVTRDLSRRPTSALAVRPPRGTR